MNIKKILHIAIALLFATGIHAQKIDARLTELLPCADGTSKARSAMLPLPPCTTLMTTATTPSANASAKMPKAL